jgi:hypothetical protein
MRELAQQVALSVYIASLGKRAPGETARDAPELCSLARALHRLNETSCHYGLTPRQEKQMQSLENNVRTALGRAGLALNHFNGDPRGYGVFIESAGWSLQQLRRPRTRLWNRVSPCFIANLHQEPECPTSPKSRGMTGRLLRSRLPNYRYIINLRGLSQKVTKVKVVNLHVSHLSLWRLS